MLNCFLFQGASYEEIRSSYKRLALKWHPDKHNNSQEATKVQTNAKISVNSNWCYIDVPVRSWVFLGSVHPYFKRKRQHNFLNGGSNSSNTC